MNRTKNNRPVVVTQFKWGGRLGPIQIKSTCGECDLTTSILKGMAAKDFKDKNVTLEVKPWLDNFFYCLLKGAWHAPVIMVNGRKFHQFSEKQPLFNKDKLIALVNNMLKEWTRGIK